MMVSRYRFQLKYILVLQLIFFALPLSAQSWEKQMKRAGLVDITEMDPTIQVRLMYASEDNFVGVNMYGDFNKAFLLPHIAQKLKRAQLELKEEWGDEYSLLIKDATRPLSVQQKMYNAVAGTEFRRYVSAPTNGGGRHNYGAAVDLTIIHLPTGEEVDMGSSVDHFGIESHTDKESELVKKGLITKKSYQNRRFLNQLMNKQGLHNIRREWWHFQERMSIKEVRQRYQLIR